MSANNFLAEGDDPTAEASQPPVIDGLGADDPEKDQDEHRRNAPFACNVCKRSYSRVDHLARHHRSHTREKPFSCEICGKTFARADLVKRHATCHSEDASKKRKRRSSLSSRASVACTACSSSKLKCASEKPCVRCVKKGLECIPLSHGALVSGTNVGLDVGGADVVRAGNTMSSTSLGAVLSQQDTQARQTLQELTSHVVPVSPQRQPHTSDPGDCLDFSNFNPGIHGGHNDDHDVIATFPLHDSGGDESTNIVEQFVPGGNALGDFLADIMMSFSPAGLDLAQTGSGTSDSLMRDVFDFGIDSQFDLDDLDLDLLNQYTVLAPPSPKQAVADESYCSPSRGEDGNAPEVDPVSVEAFQRSLWRWVPGKDDQGHCEQNNLSLPHNIGALSAHETRVCAETLNLYTRDKVLAMVLSTCEREAIPRIVTSFPPAELLNQLMQDYLTIHDQEPDSFIHIPTFQPQNLHPELAASTVAFGAVYSPVPVIRKLGFALQEAVRLALPKAFEKDNSMTRDLQLLQANILELKLGLWSGNKRKMEIAESHGLPLVTMLRRSSRFKRSRKRPVAPTQDDSPDLLDTKWRAWIEAESFTRLVHFIAIYDSQLSMSFQVPPLITHVEMSLSLPASLKMWRAKTAGKWRDEYLACGFADGSDAPAFTACVHTAHNMLEAQDRIDLAFSTHISLNMFWKVIWDARQLQAATKSYAGRSVQVSLVSGHWQHELDQTLRNFYMIVGEAEALSPAANLLHEYLLLNIYVSFEELSLFAGREGHKEARRVFASLKQWADTRDARQAIWHAGQVLREASTFTSGKLFGFYAVSLYHAGLTLWAYGLLTSGVCQARRPSLARSTSTNNQACNVEVKNALYLDSEDNGDLRKFIALNRAIPVIKRRKPPSEEAFLGEAVYLSDTKGVMATVTSVLQDHYQKRVFMPTLVENLIDLMRDLGKVSTTKAARSQ